MSRYEWERGEITIPRAAWSGLKAAVRAKHNEMQRSRHGKAIRVYDALIKASSGRRNVDWRNLAREALPNLGMSEYDDWDIVVAIFSPNQEKANASLGRLAQPIDLKGSTGRPPKPTKTLFPEAGTKVASFPMDEAIISFDESSRTVTWDVFENNHAIERAREHPLAAVLFACLRRISWDAKSGGTIVGNDEYNRGSQSGGGGANYVRERFGRAAREHERQHRTPSRTTIIHNTYAGGPFGSFGSRRW